MAHIKYLYLPIMVTYFKYLNGNPGEGEAPSLFAGDSEGSFPVQ